MRIVLAAVLLCSISEVSLRAQIDIGVSGGIPFNHFILNRTAGSRSGFGMVTSAPRRYTIGPVVEVRLHHSIGLEASALYKRFGFDTVTREGFVQTVSTTSFTTGNSLEFPLLVKAHVRLLPGVRGFLGAGPSIRRLYGVKEIGQRTTRLFPSGNIEITNYETSSPEGFDRRTSVGAGIGAGVEFRTGPLRLSPSFRVTRWDTERTSSQQATSRLGRTQLEALMSITYVAASDSEARPARIPSHFEFGLIAGVPLLPTTQVPGPVDFTTFDTPTRRYAAGAFVDWRFHPRFSLEASFLTRRFGHAEVSIPPGAQITYGQSIAGNAWEMPLLLKWRTKQIRSAQLVIGGGGAFRKAGNVQWVSSFRGEASRIDSSFVTDRSALGFALSGGVEFLAKKIRVRPEVRYFWFQSPLYDLYTVRTRKDALYAVLSASWAGRTRIP